MSAVEIAHPRFVKLAYEYLDAVLEIEQEAYLDPWTITMFRDEIGCKQSHFYVVFLDKELAGYGGFWLVADEAHITSVTVRRERRGRGLGRQLLRYLLNLAAELGACHAILEVRVSNTIAQQLYLSEGFQKAAIRKGYYKKGNEDALVMTKALGPRPGRKPWAE